jgi:glycosyltransferase involved in cell wall biosynthesis
MVRRVLMVAYHYPPVQVSSGIQRSLKFSTYLRDLGWQPSVLTIHPRAYARRSDNQLREIPADVPVRRAFGLDTSRHLALLGRYPLLLALPDNWSSWWLGGVWSGLAMIRRNRPDVIWSTYPIATAHLIAYTLHRITGIPWVADCRDSMTEENYPTPPRRRRVYQWLERKVVEHAARVVFTTPGAVRMYAERYPDVPASRWSVIANGFDEENFRSAASAGPAPSADDEITLVHSGVLYPSERDPRPFFDALAGLRDDGWLSSNKVRVRLRATGYDRIYRDMIEAKGLASFVSLEPTIAYDQALAEMLGAQGLLIFQAANCNHQIPAKLYEYFRAGRPILALTDPAGDTAAEMRQAGVDSIARLDDRDDIRAALMRFVGQIREQRAPVPTLETVRSYSREAKSGELAVLLDEVSSTAA